MLFNKDSKKRSAPQSSPHDYRKLGRVVVPAGDDQHVARFDDKVFWLNDYSEDGFSIEADPSDVPADGVATLERAGAVFHRGYAMQMWGRGSVVGFRIVNDLDVRRIERDKDRMRERVISKMRATTGGGETGRPARRSAEPTTAPSLDPTDLRARLGITR